MQQMGKQLDCSTLIFASRAGAHTLRLGHLPPALRLLLIMLLLLPPLLWLLLPMLPICRRPVCWLLLALLALLALLLLLHRGQLGGGPRERLAHVEGVLPIRIVLLLPVVDPVGQEQTMGDQTSTFSGVCVWVRVCG